MNRFASIRVLPRRRDRMRTGCVPDAGVLPGARPVPTCTERRAAECA